MAGASTNASAECSWIASYCSALKLSNEVSNGMTSFQGGLDHPTAKHSCIGIQKGQPLSLPLNPGQLFGLGTQHHVLGLHCLGVGW
jgi:hypothetical protein